MYLVLFMKIYKIEYVGYYIFPIIFVYTLFKRKKRINIQNFYSLINQNTKN